MKGHSKTKQNALKATLDGKNQHTECSDSSIYGSSWGLLIICSSRVGANSRIYGSSSKIIMAPFEHGPQKCAPPKPSFKSQTAVLLLPSYKSNTVHFLFHWSKIPHKKTCPGIGPASAPAGDIKSGAVCLVLLALVN